MATFSPLRRRHERRLAELCFQRTGSASLAIHSVEFPDPKFRYGCNFGVSDTFWDILFGTFYLPKDEMGNVLAPPRLGHPSGYPDEPNYLKILLGARAFPAVSRLLGGNDELPSPAPSSVAAE